MTGPSYCFFLAVVVLSSINTPDAIAGGANIPPLEPTPIERESGTFPGSLSLYFDNDLASQSDENYTNGLRLAWLSPAGSAEDLPSLPKKFLPLLDLFDCCGPEAGAYSHGFSLTQQIYTPQDTDVRAPQPFDRPYAGWLALGISAHERTENTIRSLEFSLGVVGPSSLAEDLQNAAHGSSTNSRAQGWDNQLRDEPTINLFASTSRRYALPKLGSSLIESDFIASYALAAGNVLTGAEIGGKIRVGYKLPDNFAYHKLGPTAYHFGPARESDRRGNFSVYLFAGAKGSLKAWDIFLDGNTYRDSLNVNKRYVVGEIEAGAGLRYKGLELTYTHSFRTEEFQGQSHKTSYGSLALAFSF